MIRRFIAYYKPVRKLLFVDMLSAIIIAGIDLITPRFTSHMIDVIIPSMNVTLVLRWSFYLLLRTPFEYHCNMSWNIGGIF